MQTEFPANTEVTEVTADQQILEKVIAGVTSAGNQLRSCFPPKNLPTTAEEILAAIASNDAISKSSLTNALLIARPNAGLTDDDAEGGLLPAGEWWVVDWVEGNINHVQGTPEWGIAVALVRDNVPILAAVYVPMENNMYTALRSHGTWLNGQRIRVSQKIDLSAAIVSTAQAAPHASIEANQLLGDTVAALQRKVLLVRVSVPSTLQLAKVSSGSADAFWQHSNYRSGQIAGLLLVQEAGGKVTDTHGFPWTLASDDLLAACPGVHAQLAEVLSTQDRKAS